jgi:hypothetical protein
MGGWVDKEDKKEKKKKKLSENGLMDALKKTFFVLFYFFVWGVDWNANVKATAKWI